MQLPIKTRVGGKLDVSTTLTPVLGQLLSFHFMRCAKQVSKLCNTPVMGLLGDVRMPTYTDVC